jgi:hypothetical protein
MDPDSALRAALDGSTLDVYEAVEKSLARGGSPEVCLEDLGGRVLRLEQLWRAPRKGAVRALAILLRAGLAELIPLTVLGVGPAAGRLAASLLGLSTDGGRRLESGTPLLDRRAGQIRVGCARLLAPHLGRPTADRVLALDPSGADGFAPFDRHARQVAEIIRRAHHPGVSAPRGLCACGRPPLAYGWPACWACADAAAVLATALRRPCPNRYRSIIAQALARGATPTVEMLATCATVWGGAGLLRMLIPKLATPLGDLPPEARTHLAVGLAASSRRDRIPRVFECGRLLLPLLGRDAAEALLGEICRAYDHRRWRRLEDLIRRIYPGARPLPPSPTCSSLAVAAFGAPGAVLGSNINMLRMLDGQTPLRYSE